LFIDLSRGAPDDLAGDLWLARANGRHARQLVAGDIEHARWSPDGTTIAYGGSAGTFVVDVKTGRTSQSSAPRFGSNGSTTIR
jgi:Tol biopolymer transport system component